jgi:N utilization substance protein A
MASCLKEVPGVDDRLVDKLLALGIVSVLDLEEVGPGPLMKELSVEKPLAEQAVAAATETAKKAAAESLATQAESLIRDQQEKRRSR